MSGETGYCILWQNTNMSPLLFEINNSQMLTLAVRIALEYKLDHQS